MHIRIHYYFNVASSFQCLRNYVNIFSLHYEIQLKNIYMTPFSDEAL